MGTRTSRPGRYAVDETDGGLRIYDVENDDAWIQSDTTLAIAWQQ